jgi:hypothetical protein
MLKSARTAVLSVVLVTTSTQALAEPAGAPANARLQQVERRRTAGIVAVFMGVLVMGGGAALLMKEEKDTPCKGELGQCIGQGIHDGISNGVTDLAGYTLLGGGGVLAIVGAVSWVSASREIAAAEKGVRVAVTPTRGGGAVVLGSRF